MESRERYTIRQHSDQPGQKFMTNDLEDAVRIATEKAKHTQKPFRIFDNKNKEIAGIVKPNGDIKRSADSVLGRSQNQAVNSGTIRVDKDALREMIRAAVAKKLGNVQEMRVRGSDQEVVKAFLNHQPMDGNKLTTNGERLDGNWMGGTGIAQWSDDKIHFKDLGSKAAQVVQNAIKKAAPNMVMAEAKKDPKAMQRDKEKKDHKKNELHEDPKVHKLTKTQLAEAVAKATRIALLEASDLGAGSYATKVDKLVSESAEAIDKLVEEGEELMRENPTHDYAIQERNHLIQARIGILKGLKTQLVKIMEDLYKKV